MGLDIIWGDLHYGYYGYRSAALHALIIQLVALITTVSAPTPLQTFSTSRSTSLDEALKLQVLQA